MCPTKMRHPQTEPLWTCCCLQASSSAAANYCFAAKPKKGRNVGSQGVRGKETSLKLAGNPGAGSFQRHAREVDFTRNSMSSNYFDIAVGTVLVIRNIKAKWNSSGKAGKQLGLVGAAWKAKGTPRGFADVLGFSIGGIILEKSLNGVLCFKSGLEWIPHFMAWFDFLMLPRCEKDVQIYLNLNSCIQNYVLEILADCETSTFDMSYLHS